MGKEGRLVIKPYGTESVIRVMAEAKTIEEGNRVADYDAILYSSLQ